MLPLTLLIAWLGQATPVSDWRILEGDGWRQGQEPYGCLVQSSPSGPAEAEFPEATGEIGAWRCVVEPGMGAGDTGILFGGGYRVLWGIPGPKGLQLLSPTGELLWQDEWAPRIPYQACILEGIRENNQVRCQLISADGKALLSQSEWFPADPAPGPSPLRVFAQDCVARFWAPRWAEEPLFPMVLDAPNRRRLAQGPDSPWVTHGQGYWAWTDETQTRVRQLASVERAWLVNTSLGSRDGVWETRVLVHPGAGGAGFLIGTGRDAATGLLCWLGGVHGAGGLMVYRNAGALGQFQEMWAGEQDKWHYNEELILRAEERGGQIQVQLRNARGELLAESPWLEVPATYDPQGCLGFHTWLGSAEFWGFTGVETVEAAGSGLGMGWVEDGGAWSLADGTLSQSSTEDLARVLREDLRGTKGQWQATVELEGDGQAGILAQTSPDFGAGFELLIGPEGVILTDLSRPGVPRWSSGERSYESGVAYRLEVKVTTDRVAVRILDEAGSVLDQSPELYVSDTNNTRVGALGFVTRGTPATFRGWSFEAE